MLKALTIFSGNANRELAQAICRYVETPLGRAEVTRFADGEVYVEINENVRGVNCFVVQPTCAPVERQPDGAADHDRRAQARVGRLDHRGHPVLRLRAAGPQGQAAHADHGASWSPTCITAAGVDRVLSIDLHAGQIQGFFNIPVDHLFAMPVLIDDLQHALRPTRR